MGGGREKFLGLYLLFARVFIPSSSCQAPQGRASVFFESPQARENLSQLRLRGFNKSLEAAVKVTRMLISSAEKLVGVW